MVLGQERIIVRNNLLCVGQNTLGILIECLSIHSVFEMEYLGEASLKKTEKFRTMSE